MKKRFAFLTLLSLFSLCACSTAKEVYKKVYFAFDTAVTVTLYNDNSSIFSNIKSTLNEYHVLFDSYSAHTGVNNLYTLNSSSDSVNVPETLYFALQKAIDLKNETSGYFNPFVGSLSDAWKNALASNDVLESNVINDYLNEMNATSLLFDEDSMSVRKEGSGNLDFGAFAKGYVLSIIKDYLQEERCANYLIDGGSSSILLGEKEDGSAFRVGLKYLDNSYLSLKNTSIGVSSIHEQKTVINDVTYSHIVNPFTGSVVPKHDTVMVIHEDPTLTDVFSTTMMLLSIDEIKAIEEERNFQVIVMDDGEITYQSSSLKVETR